jgi:hypothetical protein
VVAIVFFCFRGAFLSLVFLATEHVTLDTMERLVRVCRRCFCGGASLPKGIPDPHDRLLGAVDDFAVSPYGFTALIQHMLLIPVEGRGGDALTDTGLGSTNTALKVGPTDSFLLRAHEPSETQFRFEPSVDSWSSCNGRDPIAPRLGTNVT